MFRPSCITAVCVCLLVGFASSAVAQTDAEITAARERGVKFMKQAQKPDGHWEYPSHDVGITALCTVALIENGVPLEDEVVQKGLEFIKQEKNFRDLGNTYDLSLAVLALSRVGDRRDKPRIKELAARLIAGQMESGGWHYTCPHKIDVEKVLRDPNGAGKLKEGFGDNSCTQFAVLGLWVASRSGVNIDKTLERVAKRFSTTQKEDGGWAYGEEGGSGPAMTGAGLFCLAVAEAHRIREAQKGDGKAEDGAKTGSSLMQNSIFARGFDRTGKFVPGIAGGTQRYFMWSIERVGVLLGLEKIGNVEWYKVGSQGLIKEQKDTGGWGGTGPGGEGDKDGLSDTSFALLFLRKANLGSDISRLLEGESEQKFEIVGREKGKDKFNSLPDAVAAAKKGETIRINGEGPFNVGALEVKQDLTIQGGFGYAPILKFALGVDRLGIRLKPETQVMARSMFNVTAGKLTLEGLRIQMDPPASTAKPPIAWGGVMVNGTGSLRMTNCSFSESNKMGSAAVVWQTGGQLAIRNCLLSGGRAAVDITAAGPQELIVDNSVIFSNCAVKIQNDAKTKKPAEIKMNLRRSTIQVKDMIESPKVTGSILTDCALCVIQAEWVGANYLTTATDKKTRGWSGSLNLYDVKNFVGAAGKTVGLADIDAWKKFWNSDKSSAKRLAPFVGTQKVGGYNHELNTQSWVVELPPDADAALQRAPLGVNSFLSGSGVPFDQYRETFNYTDWSKGELGLTATALK